VFDGRSNANGFSLEIGHVLFMDMVGYSKLLINEQRKLQQQLNQIVRRTDHFCAADAAGKLIRLPVGDGMALGGSSFIHGPFVIILTA
jgi:hypothetical protein